MTLNCVKCVIKAHRSNPSELRSKPDSRASSEFDSGSESGSDIHGFAQQLRRPEDAQGPDVIGQVPIQIDGQGQSVLAMEMPLSLDGNMLALVAAGTGVQQEAATPQIALAMGLQRHPATAQVMSGLAHHMPSLVASLPATSHAAQPLDPSALTAEGLDDSHW